MNTIGAMVSLTILLCGCAGPQIVSTYGSPYSPLGPPYLLPDYMSPHNGVDFGGAVGDPIIAPASGVVVEKFFDRGDCGNGLMLQHAFDRYTFYCHMDKVFVDVGDAVKRGDLIGSIGESGIVINCRRARPCPIVHMELRRYIYGQYRATPGWNFDSLAISVGCFDPTKTYPADRLVLTYPVPCKN